MKIESRSRSRSYIMVYVLPYEKSVDVNQKPINNYMKESEKNIYNSLKYFMICSQILGLLPQENVTKTKDKLHFSWRSWRVVYTLFFVCITTFAVIVCFLDWFYVGYVFKTLVTTAMYTGALLTLLLHLRLARSWSKLILLWCRVDKIMNFSYGYPKSLDKRLHIISIIYIALGTVDYSLCALNRYNNVKLEMQNNVEQYFYDAFPQLFRFVPFNVASAIICNILEIHKTLTWAMNDLFIILMSVALALRFKQISERLNSNQKTVKSLQFWIEIREDYDRISILCKELDNHISYIILLSFSMNIFLLLVQLYLILGALNGFIGQLYFTFSFLYLIIKLVTVSLYAAWINDESLEPASILNSVPTSSYNVEIRRLLTQIGFDNIALTGCRMFRVTRGILLSIAGAIVTYELVLIQFNTTTIGND